MNEVHSDPAGGKPNGKGDILLAKAMAAIQFKSNFNKLDKEIVEEIQTYLSTPQTGREDTISKGILKSDKEFFKQKSEKLLNHAHDLESEIIKLKQQTGRVYSESEFKAQVAKTDRLKILYTELYSKLPPSSLDRSGSQPGKPNDEEYLLRNCIYLALIGVTQEDGYSIPASVRQQIEDKIVRLYQIKRQPQPSQPGDGKEEAIKLYQELVRDQRIELESLKAELAALKSSDRWSDKDILLFLEFRRKKNYFANGSAMSEKDILEEYKFNLQSKI